jgi:hypothetical protein
MNCAAVLAAGIIASEKREPSVSADEAVALMEQIAAVISDQQKKSAEKWKL